MNIPSQIRSMVPEFIWPALPATQIQPHLALLYQLERSQWWSPELLIEKQFVQLNALLEHSLTTVPYYQQSLRDAGFETGMILTPELWRKIPLLTRADIQDAGTKLHSTALPSGHGPTSVISSSGSTGRPIQSVITRIRQLFWEAITVREHLWQRRDASGKLASIRAFPTGSADYPNGTVGQNWGGAVAGIFETGPVAGLSVVSRVEQQAQWLIQQAPNYLLTFPTALRALAYHCLENNLSIPSLRQARVISEVLTTDTRTAVREAWGVEIADSYSASEMGYMALQCPDHEHFHIQSEVVYLEILRDDGSHCEPGETGRVVVTGLHNFAMPLIRYEIGDYAELGPACSCGRGLPVINRVLGRVRNMLRLPDGSEVWPLIGEPTYAEIPAIRQFQIGQKSSELLEMRLVTQRPLTTEEESKLRDIVLKRLGHHFEIALSYHESIPRSAGGKFEDFKREFEDP